VKFAYRNQRVGAVASRSQGCPDKVPHTVADYEQMLASESSVLIASVDEVETEKRPKCLLAAFVGQDAVVARTDLGREEAHSGHSFPVADAGSVADTAAFALDS
jgi:hypothetical protein